MRCENRDRQELTLSLFLLFFASLFFSFLISDSYQRMSIRHIFLSSLSIVVGFILTVAAVFQRKQSSFLSFFLSFFILILSFASLSFNFLFLLKFLTLFHFKLSSSLSSPFPSFIILHRSCLHKKRFFHWSTCHFHRQSFKREWRYYW